MCALLSVVASVSTAGNTLSDISVLSTPTRNVRIAPLSLFSSFVHLFKFSCSFQVLLSLVPEIFNRHDNLLQHLKVHRDVVPKDDVSTTGRGSRSASAAPVAPPSPPMHYLRERSYSPDDEPPSPGPPANPIPRRIYNAFTMSAYHNPYPDADPLRAVRHGQPHHQHGGVLASHRAAALPPAPTPAAAARSTSVRPYLPVRPPLPRSCMYQSPRPIYVQPTKIIYHCFMNNTIPPLPSATPPLPFCPPPLPRPVPTFIPPHDH